MTADASVVSTNQAPVVTMTVAALAFTEGNSATVVDAGLTVTDADSPNLVSATVAITANFVTGEDVLGFTNQNGITGSFNATTGVLTLTGSATVANYQTALRSVTYANASTNPSTAARTVSVVANDGTANSNTATRTITVAATNNPPVVTMTAAALAFTEGNSATVVDAGLTVTDADSTNLASATVAITANFVTGEDVLGFTTQNGITGSFNATTGVLTLTGSATVANYQGRLPDGTAGPGRSLFVAYLIDELVSVLAGWILGFVYALLCGSTEDLMTPMFTTRLEFQLLGPLFWRFLFLLAGGDFRLLAGGSVFWGCASARREARSLRAWPWAAVRTGTFYCTRWLGKVVGIILTATWFGSGGIQGYLTELLLKDGRIWVLAFSVWPLTFLGIGLMLCTMRKRNGYRGLHEWISDAASSSSRHPRLACRFRRAILDQAAVPSRTCRSVLVHLW